MTAIVLAAATAFCAPPQSDPPAATSSTQASQSEDQGSGKAKAGADLDAAVEKAIAADAADPFPIAKAGEADAENARTRVQARLTVLKAKASKGSQAEKPAKKEDPKGAGDDASADLIAVLERELAAIAEWSEEHKERIAAEHPVPSPEQRRLELERDLEKSKRLSAKAEADPKAMLPEEFERTSHRTDDAALAEMRDAVESARTEWKNQAAALEKSNAELASSGKELAELKSAKESADQKLSALRAPATARDDGGSAVATGADALELAKERLEGRRWETLAADERGGAIAAKIALAGKLSKLTEIRIKVLEINVKTAKLLYDRMNGSYQSALSARQQALKIDAAREQGKAHASDDPIERHRAKRNADLLELEAQNLRDEQRLSSNVYLSHREQAELADKAAAEFDELKKLVDEGRSRGTLAIRLKHEFRKLASIRDAIAKNEIARTEYQLTYLENELTTIEFELLNDARDDQVALDALLESLPPHRHADARRIAESIESRHRVLLEKRRALLERILVHVETAHKEVTRRREILDAKYAFIQARIFWVRDAEPLGKESLVNARRELSGLAAAAANIATEARDRSAWRGASTEFWMALGLVVAGPPLLWRLSRRLKLHSTRAAGTTPV